MGRFASHAVWLGAALYGAIQAWAGTVPPVGPAPSAWIGGFNLIDNTYAYSDIPDYFNNLSPQYSSTASLAASLSGDSMTLGGAVNGGDSPSLWMAATANASGLQALWAGGDVGIEYYYMLFDPNGPSNSGTVSILVSSGYSEETADGGAYATGGYLSFQDGPIAGWDAENSGYSGGLWTPPNTLAGNQSFTFTVPTNEWLQVYIRLSVLALGDYGGCCAPRQNDGSSSVNAFIDPTVSISSADPGSYIVYDSVLPPSTPEPHSLPLLVTGMLGIAAAARKHYSRTRPS